MNEQDKTWMGKKGFDEAYYYEDKKTDIGITYSDETIVAKINESFERNLKGYQFEISSDEGNVHICGQSDKYKAEAISLAREVSGVKSVNFSLQS